MSRIAHVITYVSEDGAFGGPVAVMRAQVQALVAAGQEVVVLAGWDGRAELRIEGAEVLLFRVRAAVPRTGFSGLWSRALVAELERRLPHLDAVHVHLGRHLLDVVAARAVARGRRRLVLQTHGMVMPSRAVKALIVDALAVRRVLRAASAVLALTADEAAGLRRVAGPGTAVRRIGNGLAPRPDVPDRDGPSGREVLFLARLHPRKRVLAFADAAALLRSAEPPVRFAVVGPDEGDLAALEERITSGGLQKVLRYEGALAGGRGADRIAAADLYVLPSRGEVFPMTVLEAASVGTPVVLAEDCAIAEDLGSEGAALVVDGSARSIADAVTALLDDRDRWAAVSRAGRTLISGRLSIEAVTATLLSAYAPGGDTSKDSTDSAKGSV